MSLNLWTLSLRRLLADLGRGGSNWTGTRAGSSLGTLTGYAVPDLPRMHELALALGLTLPAERAAGPIWYFVAAEATDARSGDIVTSATTSTLVFTVRTSDLVGGVRLCRMEPKR